MKILMATRAHANHMFAISIVVLMLVNGGVFAQTQQQHVHDMSHGVMPFDLAKTVHVFKMTESGGVERVVVKEKSNDADQVLLIQQHLREEARRFQRGDYSDPAMLHGANMPGLKELKRGAKKIKVSYSELADGAEIAFTTADPHLLTAIHRWFGAQLSEHGPDARPE